jgi:hypothetical protein
MIHLYEVLRLQVFHLRLLFQSDLPQASPVG